MGSRYHALQKCWNSPANKTWKNQNDPARFIKSTATTEDGEAAGRNIYALDLDRISEEEKYDGFFAVITNLEGDVGEILKINRQRWEIEENFRIMKTDFETRPVYVRREDRIKAHFLTCYIPSYRRTDLTDDLHKAFDFHTDYEFISKSAMRSIIKSIKTEEVKK